MCSLSPQQLIQYCHPSCGKNIVTIYLVGCCCQGNEFEIILCLARRVHTKIIVLNNIKPQQSEIAQVISKFSLQACYK